MSKKLKLIIIFFMISVFCSGCMNASATRAIRHSGFSLSNVEFVCPTLYPSNKDYDKIRYLTNTYVITTAGTVYQLSIGMPFSNNQNCKEANFNHRVVSIFDDKIIKADDGKLYHLTSSEEKAAFSLVSTDDSNYQVYKAILSIEGVVKVVTADQGANSYYALNQDGNVYNYTVVRGSGGSSATITNAVIVYSKANFGGEIIDFNYVPNSTATFIRTSNAIFRLLVTNAAECTAYADVSCEYEMKLDEGLTKYRNEILGFSGSFLITTYGKEFSASSV